MSRKEIELEAMVLDDGDSVRILCPFCNGGHSGELSCNLTKKEDTTLYNCHRASCLERGAVGGRGNFIRIKSQDRDARKQNFTPYTGELEHLSEDWESFLATKIGWTAWHLDLARPRYAPEDDRVAFPIFSPMGLRRGWVLRSYAPLVAQSRYKALTRMDTEAPHMSYYNNPDTRSCVLVVEDTPSAVRAAKYVSTVAINGGGMGPDYAREIAAHYSSVVWAMDADATATAIALNRKFSLLFNESRVLVLERDLKDETEEGLQEVLRWVLKNRLSDLRPAWKS